MTTRKKRTTKKRAGKKVARKRTGKKSGKGVSTLKKITAKAKAIKKANPKKKWATCQREAAKLV